MSVIIGGRASVSIGKKSAAVPRPAGHLSHLNPDRCKEGFDGMLVFGGSGGVGASSNVPAAKLSGAASPPARVISDVSDPALVDGDAGRASRQWAAGSESWPVRSGCRCRSEGRGGEEGR